jgi:hypothetical protein
MKAEIQGWESANQKALQSLQCLLKRIIQAAELSPTRKAIVVKYDGGMSLKIFSGDKNSALPNELYSKWALREQKEGDVLSSSRAPQQAQNAEDSSSNNKESEHVDGNKQRVEAKTEAIGAKKSK